MKWAALIFIVFLSVTVFAQTSAESMVKQYSISGEKPTSAISIAKQYQILNQKVNNTSIAKNYVIANSIYSNISFPKYYSIGHLEKAIIKENIQTPVQINSTAPKTDKINSNTYALIIGNEDYQTYQSELNTEQNVSFAVNDAKTFKEYCINTLGIPTLNIVYLENAGLGKFKQAINQMNLLAKHKNGKAKIIFYYAGHGFPDEKSHEPYLIPVDVSGNQLDMAISQNYVIDKLTEFSSEKVIVFFDACFSGGGRNQGLVAERGIKIIPAQTKLTNNLVVFSSSSSNQTSLPYKEKQHGLFTWFLLEKINESKGECTLGELDSYLVENVSIKSVLINKKEQVPVTQTSPELNTNWKNWKIY